MTNYNERLDEILERYDDQAFQDEQNYRQYRTEAKQAIASLIKELVAEAKPPAIDTSSRIKLYADGEGQMWYDRGQNDTIARFEQNLLKALEEV